MKINIVMEPILVEPISDFLIGIIGAGVETGAESEDSHGTINCYLEQPDQDNDTLETVLRQVSTYLEELASLFKVALPVLTSTMIGEEDWGKNWKKHFKPFAIVPGLVISPTWEKYEKAPGELLLEMDPGMAFGTGHHATTTLSLVFLQEVLASSDRNWKVLDVGTGTGILGMAAVLFGADDVTAIDNDPDAVRAAEENVVRNGLQDHMRVGFGPLPVLKGKHQLVVANIVQDVLLQIAADLARLTAIGGVLILSGILAGDQVGNVAGRYGEEGFVLEKERAEGEWVVLKFEKRD
ncbi:MAG: 50S ribosomal protein L11 methyltransferase [Deltaproteobacteria bacterium]|nr:50S ribosomal protein L11 methyltransferase [Deltaproteobacteria bacterium]